MRYYRYCCDPSTALPLKKNPSTRTRSDLSPRIAAQRQIAHLHRALFSLDGSHATSSKPSSSRLLTSRILIPLVLYFCQLSPLSIDLVAIRFVLCFPSLVPFFSFFLLTTHTHRFQQYGHQSTATYGVGEAEGQTDTVQGSERKKISNPPLDARLFATFSHENDNWKEKLSLPTRDERPQTEVSFVSYCFAAGPLQTLLQAPLVAVHRLFS